MMNRLRRAQLRAVPSADIDRQEAARLHLIASHHLPMRLTPDEWAEERRARAARIIKRCPVRCANSYGVHISNRRLAQQQARQRGEE